MVLKFFTILIFNFFENILFCGMCSIEGDIHFVLGDFEDALQDFDCALGLNKKEQPSVVFTRAITKFKLGKRSEALQDILALEGTGNKPNLNGIDDFKKLLCQQDVHTDMQSWEELLPQPIPQPSNEHQLVQTM